jgi:hypothetical protein
MMAKKILIAICLTWGALYPIYTSFYSGKGIDQYERHMQFLNRESLFYNPWQYRVLMPWTIEGMYFIYDNTINKVFDIEKKINVYLPGDEGTKYENTRKMLALMKTPGFVKYNIVFVALRFLLHLGIFFMCFKLYRLFVKSDWLIVFGLMFVALSMGNSIFNSDLSFNTYMDILLYLVAAYVILTKRSAWWIIPVMILGALNRETSALILVMFVASKIPVERVWDVVLLKWKSWPVRDILIAVVGGVIFVSIYVAIRSYYGYREPYKWPVPMGWPNLKWNFASVHTIRTIFENVGTYSILPIVCILGFKKLDMFFRKGLLFVALPWFIVHFWTVVGYESRVFMMPTFLLKFHKPGIFKGCSLPDAQDRIDRNIIAFAHRLCINEIQLSAGYVTQTSIGITPLQISQQSLGILLASETSNNQIRRLIRFRSLYIGSAIRCD